MLKNASAPVPAVLRQAFPDSKILVAIPAFNEGPTIGSVVLKARQFATEVVVVESEILARKEQASIKKRIRRTIQQVRGQSKSKQ